MSKSRFFYKFSVITLLIYTALVFLIRELIVRYWHQPQTTYLWIAAGYFLFITLTSSFILYQLSGNNPQKFIRAVLIILLSKLLMSAMMLGVLFYIYRTSLIPLSLTFLFYYLMSGFTLVILTNQLLRFDVKSKQHADK